MKGSVVFACVLATLGAPTVWPTTTYPVARGAASIAVPEGWKPLDPDRVELASALGPEVTKGLITAAWTDALRSYRGDSERLFPTILVEVHDTRRIPWPAFVGLAREFANGQLDADLRPVPFVGETLDASMSFDTQTYQLHSESYFGSSAVGPILVRSVTALTERGTITVHGVARAGLAPNELRAVDEILASLTLAPEIAYQPRLSDLLVFLDRVDWRTRAAIAGLLCIGGLLMLRWVIRRRAAAS